MPTFTKAKAENFKSQTEADADYAENGSAGDAVRNARKPLDFVPGEIPQQRAARLKMLGIVDTTL